MSCSEESLCDCHPRFLCQDAAELRGLAPNNRPSQQPQSSLQRGQVSVQEGETDSCLGRRHGTYLPLSLSCLTAQNGAYPQCVLEVQKVDWDQEGCQFEFSFFGAADVLPPSTTLSTFSISYWVYDLAGVRKISSINPLPPSANITAICLRIVHFISVMQTSMKMPIWLNSMYSQFHTLRTSDAENIMSLLYNPAMPA